MAAASRFAPVSPPARIWLNHVGVPEGRATGFEVTGDQTRLRLTRNRIVATVIIVGIRGRRRSCSDRICPLLRPRSPIRIAPRVGQRRPRSLAVSESCYPRCGQIVSTTTPVRLGLSRTTQRTTDSRCRPRSLRQVELPARVRPERRFVSSEAPYFKSLTGNVTTVTQGRMQFARVSESTSGGETRVTMQWRCASVMCRMTSTTGGVITENELARIADSFQIIKPAG